MKKMTMMMAAALLAVASYAQVTEDFKPATTNQEGSEYPMVNSAHGARENLRS